ncbi:hypothetical protein [Bauldia sp.]|uniref:hypothetical protein n=1 Tax=Bauldia sp. TaxID=2575872 RepID=UPI003BA856DD
MIKTVISPLFALLMFLTPSLVAADTVSWTCEAENCSEGFKIGTAEKKTIHIYCANETPKGLRIQCTPEKKVVRNQLTEGCDPPSWSQTNNGQYSCSCYGGSRPGKQGDVEVTVTISNCP